MGFGISALGNTADWLEALDRWDRPVGGLDSFVRRVRIPLGPSNDQVMECIRRLGKEVWLPKHG